MRFLRAYLLLLLSLLGAGAVSAAEPDLCREAYALLEGTRKFGNHSSSFVYNRRNPQNAQELAEANLEIMSRIARGESSANLAEIFSGRHQGDMLQALGVGKNKRRLEREGFRTTAFINGVLDSDKGKTALYKQLLTEHSEKSELLLDTLRGVSRKGNEKSVAALKKLLQEAKLDGQLLNPNLSNETLRAIFKDRPMLQNFLHELPGISDAILAHERGVISSEEFILQVKANLFHNGPGKGFWNFFTSVLVPGDLAKSAHPNAKTFFSGTVFQGAIKDGVVSPNYPLPISFEGIFHTILDRLSQGSRGGIMKIAYELPASAHGVAVFNDMLFTNTKGTLDQFVELRAHILRATDSRMVTREQGKLLSEAAEKAEKRIRSLQEYIGKHVSVSGEGTERVLTLRDPRGVTHSFRANDPDPALRERMSGLVKEMLKHEEAAHGSPLQISLD
jgi:hypothetical protein